MSQSSIPFLSASRTVLLLCDEAMIIYEVSARSARLVRVIPWDTPDIEETVAEVISKECGGKPVMMLYDMVEQHYRKERIPKVGPLDRANVVQRKLNVTFQNYVIRAALPLKEKGAKSKEGGGLYLFAAVPSSEFVKVSLGAVKRSLAPVAGFYLLPVESAGLVKSLSAKIAKKRQEKSRWSVFIGHHHSGGLRQVVTRDGELALSRITPVHDVGSNPEAWATEVAKEFKSTMSYLSRLGFKPDEGLDVIVISTPAAGEILAGLLETPCHFTHMTVQEAANMLNVPIGIHKSETYADPLHVAWAGRKNSFVMRMDSKDIQKIHRPRQAAMVAMLALICGLGYFSYQAFTTQAKIAELSESKEAQERALSFVEADYQNEIEKKRAIGIDVEMLKGSLGAVNDLEDYNIDVLPLINDLAYGLGPGLTIDSIMLSSVGSDTQSPFRLEPTDTGSYMPPAEEMSKPLEQMSITIKFAATIEPEVGNKEIEDLRLRLVRIMPDFDVNVVREVKDLSYRAGMSGESGIDPTVQRTEDYVAELIITRKSEKNDTDTGT